MAFIIDFFTGRNKNITPSNASEMASESVNNDKTVSLSEEQIKELRGEISNELKTSIMESLIPQINTWCDARYRKKLVNEKRGLKEYIEEQA